MTTSLKKFEGVDFDVVLPRAYSAGELNRHFRALGYTLHYDVYSLERKSTGPTWQTESLVAVQLFLDGKSADAQDRADHIRLLYLLASLDSSFIEPFADAATSLADRVDGQLQHEGRDVDRNDIVDMLTDLTEELMREWGEEPGSESLAIMIARMYQR